VTLLNKEDVEAGVLKLDNIPRLAHPSIPEDQIEAFSKIGTIGLLLSLASGAWDTTDEWNKLIPDFKFTKTADYIRGLWASK
jgi:hypothetical protein